MEAEAGFEVALEAGEHLAEGGVLAILAGDLERFGQRDADAGLEGHQGAEINQFPPMPRAMQPHPAGLDLGAAWPGASAFRARLR